MHASICFYWFVSIEGTTPTNYTTQSNAHIMTRSYISTFSTSDLIKMREQLLDQDAYDFEDQERISEDIFRINFELRVTRDITI